MDIILFGDQTVDCKSFLSTALRPKGSPLLSSFLEQVHSTIQNEVATLSSEQRLRIIPSSNIAELVERYYAAAIPNPSMESAIVCLAQLAHFIGFFEEQSPTYPDIDNTQIVGVCTGLISAAVVASCNSLSALIPLAVQAVRIAFRVGMKVAVVRDQLESQFDYHSSWSTVVLGITPEEAEQHLADFNEGKGLATANRPYMSAVGLMSVTISAAPSIRKRLFEFSAPFQNLQRRDIPIHGPYHAAHLYDTEDLDDIITDDIYSRIQAYHGITPIIGLPTSSTPACSTIELLKDSITKVLTEPVKWDQLVEKCVSTVRSSNHAQCQVLAMGPTTLGQSLISSLKIGEGLKLSLEDHVSWTSKNRIPSNVGSHASDSKIAIIGMAGRFPGAADHEKFWQLLEQGLDVHRTVPSDRFDVQKHTDGSGKGRNKSHTPYGCFIEQPGLFDPRFFNMSPREAAQTDPMQRLALTTAYEAMEMAGFVVNRTPSSQAHRIGTFFGQTSDDWREINAAQDIDTYFITGGVRAFGPGRINYHFGFSGPSFSIDTACSSSLAAIQLACTSLRARDCDTVFTGGMNVMTNPDIFSGLSKGQFLSKTGSCKTYDNDADGYCRGDGVVTLILKRLEDAIADKDPVLGVIAGIATNHSAEAVSITHPHADTQKILFQKVMTDAFVNVHDVSYVEMHGTGTQAGDGVEMESVSSIFAPRDVRSKRRLDQPLFVGSIKSNIGHGEAASGACALVKILLMLEKDVIPPHCGIKNKINEGFPKDLRERNLQIAFRPTSLPRPANGKRFIFLNNFSAAGGNTAMLLEDAPYLPAIKPDPRSSQVVAVSAKSLSSFRQNLKKLLAWIETHPSISLPSLAYTTTARRAHYNYRVAIAATDLHCLREALSSVIQGTHIPVSSTKPKVAFVFTGQGSQYLGMARELFNHAKHFRLDILGYDRIARGQGFPSFIGLIDGSTTDIAAVSPIAVQLAIVCVEVALARLWKSWGVVPSVVIGHSLGEYAALNAAGVLSLFDTISLVGQRAQLMVATCSTNTHGMLAVRSDFATVRHLLSDFPVETACINGPEEIVFATLSGEIDKLEKVLRVNGFKGTKLNVPYAFHSSQVEPLLDSFAQIAKSATFHEPHIPIISPLMREVIDRPGILCAEYLARHCREPVDFLGGLHAALRGDIIDDSTVFVELGPHPICSSMIKATLGPDTITVPALRRNEDAWKTSTGSLSTLFNVGYNINWSQYHQHFDESHEALTLPAYSFDEKVYWIDYKEDWCLTKGDKLIPDSVKPAFSTTSIQKIIYEEIKGDSAIFIGESDLTDPLLRTAISGHLVNGVGLCPSSIYADMAYTICDYAYRTIHSTSTEVSMNIGSMETHKPLVVDTTGKPKQQILQIEAKFNLSQSRATVAYRSISPDGKTSTDYAKCVVTFGNPTEWASDWARFKFFVRERIDSLIAKDSTHRIHRGMAYKLFSALVNYDDRYRGMEEVVLDSENLEATASISFQTTKADGSFYMSPYLIDSVAHVSGFIMNANDALDSKKNVYISHGWKSMMFARRLDLEKKYRSYVKMQPVAGAGQMVAGDVYVFEGEEIVGVIAGLKFQCVPRVHLEILLKPVSAILQPKTAATSDVVSGRALTFRPLPETVMSKAISEELKLATKIETMHPVPTSFDITSKALNIIADEVGCHISELADIIGFSDLGVDSLMSLCVSGRFREELEIDVHSTLFTDMPTVGQLKSFLQQFETNESPGSRTPDMESGTSVTSQSELDFPQFSDDVAEVQDSNSIIHIIRSTIADEMGINFEEISDTTDLATMGMDSLMSLAILGALRERTGLTLNSDLLIENTSVDKIEKSLGLGVEKRRTGVQGTTIISTTSPVPSGFPMKPLSSYPPAQSILLQGNPKTATQRLFLLPDGSGSATSYTTIPTISPVSLCVYGLNCPFMKDPSSFTIGVQGVTQIYLNEIKRRQAHGPYLLGGWSAGGVLAYELTRQLLAQGETVSKLVLIDSPCPLGLEALPTIFHKFCDSIGLLGNGEGPGKIPSWLLPHFAASVRELTSYSEFLDTQEIDTSGMPSTTAIWARDGIVKREEDPKPEWDEKMRMPNSMKWLVENRKDLGPNGWEKLLGKGKVNCVSTTGNHFTMMKLPIVNDVGALIRQALGVE